MVKSINEKKANKAMSKRHRASKHQTPALPARNRASGHNRKKGKSTGASIGQVDGKRQVGTKNEHARNVCALPWAGGTSSRSFCLFNEKKENWRGFWVKIPCLYQNNVIRTKKACTSKGVGRKKYLRIFRARA